MWVLLQLAALGFQALHVFRGVAITWGPMWIFIEMNLTVMILLSCEIYGPPKAKY